MVRLRGRDLILATMGVTVLYALFLGPFTMALELLVCPQPTTTPARLAR